MKTAFRILNILTLALLLAACGDNEPKVHSSIAGTWRCEETSSLNGTRTYLVDIDRTISDTTQYIITNFYNTGDTEFIKVKLKSNKLTITQQPTSNITVDPKLFSGSVIDLTQIILSYTVRDGLSDVKVEATYSRN